MKKLFLLFTLVNSVLHSQIKIGLANISGNAEEKAAFVFLESCNDFRPTLIDYDIVKNKKSDLSQFAALWIHRADSTDFSAEETNPEFLESIRSYVESGGNLFLTLDAMKYLNYLGVEKVVPTIRYADAYDEGYGRRLGFHAMRTHPLFTGMNGGAYIFNPEKDIKTRQIGFFGDSVPENGKVAAVDWAYITLKENSKLVVEYNVGKGKILAVGAYEYFAIKNNSRDHLELFTRNCINYLAGKFDNEKKYYWDYSPAEVNQKSFADAGYVPSPLNKALVWRKEENHVAIKEKFAADNYWDVAGQRMLVMGKEKGGIEEIWAHPFMAIRDYEVGIKFSYADSIYWLSNERPRIEVHPESFERIYKFRRAYLTEIITSSITEPAAVVHYEYRGVFPAKLYVKFKSNMRFMWPYSEKALGGIDYTFDAKLNAFGITDKGEELCTLVGANKKSVRNLIGHYADLGMNDSTVTAIPAEDLIVGAFSEFDLQMNDNLDIVIAASNEGVGKTSEVYRNTIDSPESVYKETKKYTGEFLNNSLMITTPDENFNRGYKWALLGTDRFFVNTPGIGKSLVAGYSTTARGWDGNQKVNGRPGYAWYFGRDGVWSGFAILDYGDFAKVKSMLEFFNKYQDLNGKIFHELTTSGAVHYDASDSTPLYIILAGRYFEHSGDVEFIKQSWPNIKKAIDFCYSTDTDGDHLIENTNVGHGWVEGGGLYKAHTEAYLAACWAKALEEAGLMAEKLGLKEESSNYFTDAAAVKYIIENNFWNSKENFLSFSKLIDGSFNPEKTVLAAVPVYFGMLDSLKASAVVSAYAENYFSSDWGVRILRDDSPIFNPRGYHTGSVWPLFTGWSALAEFGYGNSVQGFSHLMNNLNVYKNWSLGFVEEVLNGAEYKPAGVCPHQCWSETMVLQPAIEGMLGLEVNAPRNLVKLSPRIPADWNFLKAEKIRVGKESVDFSMSKEKGKIIYRFNSTAPVNIEFKPQLPLGAKISGVAVNKIKHEKTSSGNTFNFRIDKNYEIEIDYAGGIAVLPAVSDPKPGYASEGFRILSESISGNIYSVDAQGLSNGSGTMKLYLNEGKILSVENGKLLGNTGSVYNIMMNFDSGKEKYVNKTVKIIFK